MRRLFTVLFATSLVLAACGDDGGGEELDPAEEQAAADRAIAAFEATAEDEGFDVTPDDDDDSDLEFESEECRDLDAALDNGDEEVAGQTADVESDDFARGGDEGEESLAATVVFADADALQEELDLIDDDRTAPCIEEAMVLLFEELGQEQGVELEARNLDVEVEQTDLGDDGVRITAGGNLAVGVVELPFSLEVHAVRDGRQGVTVMYTAVGAEAALDTDSFIDVLLDPPDAA